MELTLDYLDKKIDDLTIIKFKRSDLININIEPNSTIYTSDITLFGVFEHLIYSTKNELKINAIVYQNNDYIEKKEYNEVGFITKRIINDNVLIEAIYDKENILIYIFYDIQNILLYHYLDNGLKIKTSLILDTKTNNNLMNFYNEINKIYLKYFSDINDIDNKISLFDTSIIPNLIDITATINDDTILFTIKKDYWEISRFNKNNYIISYKNSNNENEFCIYDDNDNILFSKDSKGNEYKYVYDNNMNLIKVILNDNEVTETYKYDSNNNLIYYESKSGYVKSFFYDTNNNLIFFNDNEKNWMFYGYNENNDLCILYSQDYYWEKRIDKKGNIHETTIINKNKTKRIYDKKNRLIYEKIGNEWYSYKYDKKDNLIWYENSKGVWYVKVYENNKLIDFNNYNFDKFDLTIFKIEKTNNI